LKDVRLNGGVQIRDKFNLNQESLTYGFHMAHKGLLCGLQCFLGIYR